ncbi:hypothetical protein A2841_03175 [Candidatus Kaiserbacteria bacterium RIFCSPHIGHO2_01_FULL_48_10]|uniref:Uncharacterized protein n=1 Tax=Candidatus Kaiserbacteria bacterium RIFCSPHIGHO2_01_FULL_48_10 TaxID=1798476 RepID=A0A1F6C1F6_9BACT|nr:MAG: hypothetical protein A2841_03175 [Candidatus Kaiserbacteria bacterium RIFCSPHIGHO2_01_FULL_48_10]
MSAEMPSSKLAKLGENLFKTKTGRLLLAEWIEGEIRQLAFKPTETMLTPTEIDYLRALLVIQAALDRRHLLN